MNDSTSLRSVITDRPFGRFSSHSDGKHTNKHISVRGAQRVGAQIATQTKLGFESLIFVIKSCPRTRVRRVFACSIYVVKTDRLLFIIRYKALLVYTLSYN